MLPLRVLAGRVCARIEGASSSSGRGGAGSVKQRKPVSGSTEFSFVCQVGQNGNLQRPSLDQRQLTSPPQLRFCRFFNLHPRAPCRLLNWTQIDFCSSFETGQTCLKRITASYPSWAAQNQNMDPGMAAQGVLAVTNAKQVLLDESGQQQTQAGTLPVDIGGEDC